MMNLQHILSNVLFPAFHTGYNSCTSQNNGWLLHGHGNYPHQERTALTTQVTRIQVDT